MLTQYGFEVTGVATEFRARHGVIENHEAGGRICVVQPHYFRAELYTKVLSKIQFMKTFQPSARFGIWTLEKSEAPSARECFAQAIDGRFLPSYITHVVHDVTRHGGLR